MMKKVLLALAALAIFLVGFYASKGWYSSNDTRRDIDTSVVLEQINNVFKVVTVEGQFSEIYDETNYKEYTFMLPLPNRFTFPKTATLQVTGKVLVGYDMEGIDMTVDSLTKTITLKNIPTEAEVLAIDHELSYKNLDESFFNSFKPADYTKLNKNAKAVLKNQALESTLLEKAKAEGNQIIQMIELMASSIGYTVVYKTDNAIHSNFPD